MNFRALALALCLAFAPALHAAPRELSSSERAALFEKIRQVHAKSPGLQTDFHEERTLSLLNIATKYKRTPTNQ